jgi:hypothetical protein
MATSRVGRRYQKKAKKGGIPGKKTAPSKPAPKTKPVAKTGSAEVKGRTYKDRSERAEATTPAKPKPKARVYTNRDAAPKPRKPDIKPRKVDMNRVESKFGVGNSKTVTHKGKKMANVTAEQLKKSGLSLRAYMNQWNKTGKRP